MSKSDGHWFSHDNNTSLNPKIICLEAEYGFAGSGRFWRLLEIIHTQEGYKYGISDKVGFAALVKQLAYTTDELKQYLNYCIEIGLIQTDGEYIWNDSQIARMEYWDKRKEVLSERGKKGAATTNAKRSAQANQEVGTSAEQANEISTNETKPNNTKPNETTPNNNTAVDVEVFKGNNSNVIELTTNTNTTASPTMTIAELRDRCFDDVEFCAIYTQVKNLPPDRLYAWLGAFNKWLVYTADTQKDEQEYRKHFRNWLHQKDLARDTPDNYNPVSEKSFSKPAQRTIPMEMPKKTVQEALAEKRAREEAFLRNIKAGKGDNKVA